MRVTIKDVAKRAGVSIATVSRVLNDTCPVDEEKKQLVFRATQELKYRPNPAARSLLNKSTGGLGVLLPYVRGEFFSQFLSGIDKTAQESGFFLMISTAHRHHEDFSVAMQSMDKRVDGLIIMAPGLTADDAESIPIDDTPVVFVNTHIDRRPFDVINFDNFGGSYELTKHLIGNDHTNIAVIKGPPELFDAKERLQGYRAAMKEIGQSDTSALEFSGGYDQEDGYRAAMSILDSGIRPTAIMAANDYCAMGVLSALHESDIEVPKDIAVAGFDGLASSQFTLPPLTSVEVPIQEMGSLAIARLISKIRMKEGRQDPWRKSLDVRLVTRDSA